MNFIENPDLALSNVLHLYDSVGWTNYTQNPQMVAEAIKHSLFVLAAFDGEQLVGLLRAVGDGVSILFIQDILVHPAYQHQGIGRTLVQKTLEKYVHVYQIHLLTDQTEKTAAFYTSLGFQPVETIACRAFTWIK
ncbi:GNAT family N-acetyltransferase [Streptococcus gallolyticus]|uniref:GNAT family N-acetyltransferase n=1 Tax=Streptococcus hepaticus TaxID=3349163 RepID=UPI001C980734|nr:GNAT family N-acetyltransferase [Streptococcus gallolyticus]MBY5040486.1 GNAT family N-acetyltransferase [Streptococcus gallolyticus]